MRNNVVKDADRIRISPAATVMILRKIAPASLEVLLLKRNSDLAFAPDFWVFPGGRIDEEELSRFSREEEAARAAAVREAKEECDLVLKPSKLSAYYHWTTPAGGDRRFGTWFFYTIISNPHMPVTIDGGEIIDALWITPLNAITMHHKGDLPLLPPTFVSLTRLIECQNATDINEEFNRTGPLKVEPVVRFVNNTFYCLYRGDAGYESGNPFESGARHRLVNDQEHGIFHFEFVDCDHIIPVTGRQDITDLLPY